MKHAHSLLLTSLLISLNACGTDATSPHSPVSDTSIEDAVSHTDAPDTTVEAVDAVLETASPEDAAPAPEVDDASATDIPTIDSAEPPTNDSTEPAPSDTTKDATVVTKTASLCFADKFDPNQPGPDHDQFNPIVAEHCLGTNHQNIVDVEQVVFLGDSVTVGTPNLTHPLSTDNSHFFRNRLAEWLADQYGLERGNDIEWGLWKAYDYVEGTGSLMQAGDFRNCSKWGARTDDLLEGGEQIQKCLPEGGSDKRTLVVFTIGGNDIAKITQEGGDADEEEVAAGYPEAWELAESTIQYLQEALVWLRDPVNFPNGSYVIFANPFEFTDGTGNVAACATASIAGYTPWEDPAMLRDIVTHIGEQYTKLAVDTQTDVLWVMEEFCGHGYVTTGEFADTNNQCYLEPDAKLYFDETCTHPSPAGHKALYKMFKSAVSE